MSRSTIDVAQIREDLKNLTTKKKIREQDLKARGQFYAVVAISQRDNVSMKEAATIYLESQPKSK